MSPTVEGGRYYGSGNEVHPVSALAQDEALQGRLWDHSLQLYRRLRARVPVRPPS